MLVGSSAVAVEALAYGCDVLVPGFASAPRLTPLAGWESFYRDVFSPQELAQAVADIDRNGPRRTAAEKRAFVAQYWAIDPDLPRWNAWLDAGPAERNAI